MGNVALCLAGGPVVKVMLPDATIEKYDRAVQVAELASSYPNYAVVHCSTARPCAGQSRAVIIMKMEEFLVPGQAYILHPIPKSFTDSMRYADEVKPVKPAKSSDPDVGGERKAKMGSGRKEEETVVTAEELAQSLSHTLMGPALRRLPSEAELAPRVETQAKLKGGEKKEKADLASEPWVWTPDLYQIAED